MTRARQRAIGVREIDGVRAAGFSVRALTPYQFRVNGVLDLFPTARRFHDLVLDRRGNYDDLLAFVRSRCTSSPPCAVTGSHKK